MGARICCDRGALTPALERRRAADLIQVFQPAQDNAAFPRTSEIRDLNLKRTDAHGALADYRGSPRFEEVLLVLGFSRRREAALVDWAFTQGCALLVTEDPDILRRRAELELLVGVRAFHPIRDEAALLAIVDAGK